MFKIGRQKVLSFYQKYMNIYQPSSWEWLGLRWKYGYQVLYPHLSVFVLVVAERGSKRHWAQDPPSSGEDPPAEGDQTGAAYWSRRSVQLQKENRSVVCSKEKDAVVFTIWSKCVCLCSPFRRGGRRWRGSRLLCTGHVWDRRWRQSDI